LTAGRGTLFMCAASDIIVPALGMTSSDNQFRSDGVNQSNAIDVLCVIILIAYLLHFALPALGGAFSEDEMMSVYIHWFTGTLKSLWENVCFWKGIGRPGGALYYLPLYHFFRLNPQPYRIAQISVLAASIPMVYHLARLLCIFALGGIPWSSCFLLSRSTGHFSL